MSVVVILLCYDSPDVLQKDRLVFNIANSISDFVSISSFIEKNVTAIYFQVGSTHQKCCLEG